MSVVSQAFDTVAVPVQRAPVNRLFRHEPSITGSGLPLPRRT
jgi:hypothetical protein